MPRTQDGSFDRFGSSPSVAVDDVDRFSTTGDPGDDLKGSPDPEAGSQKAGKARSLLAKLALKAVDWLFGPDKPEADEVTPKSAKGELAKVGPQKKEPDTPDVEQPDQRPGTAEAEQQKKKPGTAEAGPEKKPGIAEVEPQKKKPMSMAAKGAIAAAAGIALLVLTGGAAAPIAVPLLVGGLGVAAASGARAGVRAFARSELGQKVYTKLRTRLAPKGAGKDGQNPAAGPEATGDVKAGRTVASSAAGSKRPSDAMHGARSKEPSQGSSKDPRASPTPSSSNPSGGHPRVGGAAESAAVRGVRPGSAPGARIRLADKTLAGEALKSRAKSPHGSDSASARQQGVQQWLTGVKPPTTAVAGASGSPHFSQFGQPPNPGAGQASRQQYKAVLAQAASRRSPSVAGSAGSAGTQMGSPSAAHGRTSPAPKGRSPAH